MPGYRSVADAPTSLPNEIQMEHKEIKPALRDTTKDVIRFQKIFILASDQQNPRTSPETQLEIAEGIAKQLAEGKRKRAMIVIMD